MSKTKKLLKSIVWGLICALMLPMVFSLVSYTIPDVVVSSGGGSGNFTDTNETSFVTNLTSNTWQSDYFIERIYPNGSVLLRADSVGSDTTLSVGTEGYVPIFTSDDLADSDIFNNNSYVGIRTTNPITTLHVDAGEHSDFRGAIYGYSSGNGFFDGEPYGVHGVANSSSVSWPGQAIGVFGESIGVNGDTRIGVKGEANVGTGVLGESTTGVSGIGTSTGVYGVSSSSGGSAGHFLSQDPGSYGLRVQRSSNAASVPMTYLSQTASVDGGTVLYLGQNSDDHFLELYDSYESDSNVLVVDYRGYIGQGVDNPSYFVEQQGGNYNETGNFTLNYYNATIGGNDTNLTIMRIDINPDQANLFPDGATGLWVESGVENTSNQYSIVANNAGWGGLYAYGNNFGVYGEGATGVRGLSTVGGGYAIEGVVEDATSIAGYFQRNIDYGSQPVVSIVQDVGSAGVGAALYVRQDGIGGDIATFEDGPSKVFRILDGGDVRVIGNINATAGHDICIEGGNCLSTVGSGSIDGSGTANYLSKFSDSDTLTDSLVYDDGTNVGIGTTSPNDLLTLSGASGTNLSFSDQDTAVVAGQEIGNIVFYSADTSSSLQNSERAKIEVSANPSNAFGAAHDIGFFTRDTSSYSERMTIKSNGQVGIGDTTPDYKLDVNGQIGSGQLTLEDQDEALVFDSGGWGAVTDLIRVVDGSSDAWRMEIVGTTEVDITHANGDYDLQNGDLYADEVYIGDGDDGLGVITGQYGSVQTLGSGFGNWEGYSIRGDYVFMSDDSNSVGIYDDSENQWIMLREDDNYLRFYEPDSGNVAMQIHADGDISMGSATNPGHNLMVYEPSSSFNYNQFSNTGTGTTSTDGTVVGIDANEDAVLWNFENNDLIFGTNNAERMRIESDGDIAVGRTSTSYDLDIYRVGPTINLESTGGIDSAVIRLVNDARTVSLLNTNYPSSGGSQFSIVNPSNTLIGSSGGTTANAKLHVVGDGLFTSDLEVQGDLVGDSCPIKTAVFSAEENGGLDVGYEWSFGNGAAVDWNGASQLCDGKLVGMTVACDTCSSTTSTVEVRINTVGTACETDINLDGSAGRNGRDTACSDAFNAGDIINFYTLDDAGTCNICTATVYVQYD